MDAGQRRGERRLLSEYDALPGLGNAAVPRQQPREDGQTNGHGCGHNLLGAALTAAAIAAKTQLEHNGVPGTLKVFGEPTARLHYIFEAAGQTLNVVPDYARMYLVVRDADRERIRATTAWIEQAARGAALATQTEVRFDHFFGMHDILLRTHRSPNVCIE